MKRLIPLLLVMILLLCACDQSQSSEPVVTESLYRSSGCEYTQTFQLSRTNGRYVHFLVENRHPDQYCYIRINDGESVLLEHSESGTVTASVTGGDYRFFCGCDIGGVDVHTRIIQNDTPAPPNQAPQGDSDE